MGQVPRRIGVIGDGRAARHLIYCFGLCGLDVRQWSRRIAAPWDMADRDVVVLALSDGAIEPFYREHSDLHSKTVFHLSGSLVLPDVPGIHPLVSFGPDLYQPAFYSQIPWVGEIGRPGLSDVLPELSNPSFAIPSEQRAFYHALCVMSGNFTTLLWQRFQADLEALGIPGGAMQPYLTSVYENLRNAPADALTGPIARGDEATIDRNLSALGYAGHPFQNVYQAFVQATKKEADS